MKNKTVLLIFLLLCLFQVNLISLITSRIEGTVLDGENELPIFKAKIALFKCIFTDIGISCNMIKHTETESNGKFKFNDILKGEYFLSVFKEGQIKHFMIKMEKEAILKVYIKQLLPNGIEISP